MQKATKKVEKVLEYILPVKVKPQKEGYLAYSPAWEDCYAQGVSIEEAVSEINRAAQTLVEIYREEGMEIPLKSVEKDTQLTKTINVSVFVST